ncbi:hypothetical protein GCM10011351_22850 [Paraliobacillus quinghaiensis]|uniref:Uncharacterized protein n=1 Tax=Paraliobacillus quinghaiensis TaxID=470815 RepID=A0A917WVI0_9BACI|nr:hypothetical protein [Paraliobacillus quinghaiensis]GGM36191.1 hypothetical protein GCM10011351_22850 [Paraliobacillus quinghaiensis]
MKYVYLLFISLLIVWETDSLQDIFEFPLIWQYTANIVLVVYFAYLLNINIPLQKAIRLIR